ncbi:MAG: MaoC family dehydratase N-terminal domain-containing protein, partial [Chloroflexi bacterium]|nr:MaoC family dehydratase N-terminal domain-containing protein [Chloroflexota bacterium]
SEETKQRLQALTEESEPEAAPLEVNEYLIRHWCETLEDGNPLYHDEGFAKSQGFRSVVAPPATVMTTFSMPFRWPWPPENGEPDPHIHYTIKKLLDLPVGIINEIEVENQTPLQIGDRVSVSQKLVSISPWKRTRVGEGHFWTMERIYRNQNGEIVTIERMTAFGYGREESKGAAQDSSNNGWSPAVEEAIEGEKTGYTPPEYADRYWEDVNEGDELPELVMPITTTRCAYLASATRDFSPQHSNRDYAQEQSKARDVFVNTPFNIGMISRFMTDWGGPRSVVRKVNISMRGQVCAGDDMIITGHVTKKYREGDEGCVDIEVTIATQDGPVTPSGATVALPSRSGAK